jgi:ABC-2 type transport system ATP-binding protein
MVTAQIFPIRNERAHEQVAQFESVSKSFGAVHALTDFTFSVRAGQLTALLGPNGAGKTTAIKLLLGLLRPAAGKVSVFGGNPSDTATHMRVGAMLQVGRVPETLRVREHLDLFSSYYPRPLRMAEALAIAGIEDIANRKFGDLSGGQKQRVLFALAICGDPDLLFLDEPTVGLDVEARHLLWQEIRAMLGRGKTVVLTTHYLEEGTPAEIKARTGGKRIRCVTQVSHSLIRAIPGVVEVQSDRDALIIQTTDAEGVLRALFSLDLDISNLEVTSAGLEEAILALTRNEHRRIYG